MKYLLLRVVFMLSFMVAGCGMQGDLYLPKDDAGEGGTTQNQEKGS